MLHRNAFSLSARDDPFTVIVEPWAEEFQVDAGSTCKIVALNPDNPPSFDVELYRGALVVTILESESTFEFWRGNMMEFSMPIAIPTML